MTLATDVKVLGRHLADILEAEKANILLTDGTTQAFNKAVYGEPRVIQTWPMLSVQPVEKNRTLREGATRKFSLNFRISVVLYHGKVADTLDIQEEGHDRAERVEQFLHTDYKWNFVDTNDSTKDQVIFGFVTMLDHPVVVAPSQELWTASRLELNGLSQEVF